MNLQSQRRRLALFALAIWVNASLAGCDGSGATSPAVASQDMPVSVAEVKVDNQVPVLVDAGPPEVNSMNTLYTTVTLCAPGSSEACQTIDYVQVDTGSTGFRVLASALGGALLPSQLEQAVDLSGKAIVECAQFVEGFSWGPVKIADLKIGGETAGRVPIQIIGDPEYSARQAPDGCINVPDGEEQTVERLGANGILGIGNYLQDCGLSCTEAALQPNVAYNTCTQSTPISCKPASVALSQQVSNPVAFFASDNNGVLIKLPAVPGTGAATVEGLLVFGIGTRTNNVLGSALVYTLDSQDGTLTTIYSGAPVGHSFLDTGSSARFFSDQSIPVCQQQPSYYCPATSLSLVGELQGSNGRTTYLPFAVGNAVGFLASVAAAPDLAGSAGAGAVTTFAWGLPFFFGRNVFVIFEGASVGDLKGPSVAF
jgi:hypothetical protein